MDIILTKGNEQMRLPASAIFVNSQNKTLEDILNEILYDIEIDKVYPKIVIDDNNASTEKVYSSVGTNTAINKIINNGVYTSNKTYSSSKIEDLLQEVRDYAARLSTDPPVIASASLVGNQQIEVVFTEVLTSRNVTKAGWSVSIDGTNKPLNNCSFMEATTLSLYNGCSRSHVELVDNKLQIEGW